MVPVLLLALLIPLASGAASDVARRQEAEPVCVLANLADDTGAMELETLRRIFLLRQRFWPDGTPAHPVNLPASSPVREHFSTAAFGQTVREMAPYWNERYFHGTRPPPTMASEEAVRLFLARTPGGVGYVSEGATVDLPPGVRVLTCLR